MRGLYSLWLQDPHYGVLVVTFFCDPPRERVGNSDIKKTDRTLLEGMGTKNSDFNARIMVGLDGE